MTVTWFHIVIAIALVLTLQAGILILEGHTFICPCGHLKFFDGGLKGVENSQNLFDWYSFVHLVYGMFFYGVGSLLRKKFGWPVYLIFLGVLLLSFGWEVIENTHFVISRYRAVSTSMNYYGDSIVNSLSDTLCTIAGFGLAYALPVPVGVASFAILTLLTTLILHDNIFIGTLTFFMPINSVVLWQGAASVYH